MTDTTRIATGNELATAICAAIGVDVKNVAKLTIECEPQEAAFITIERFVTVGESAAIAKATELYHLVKLFPAP